MSTPKIELRDVQKAFGSKQVLRGVNLSVAPSESMVIIGGSGSGKSVTIKSVLGLIKPDAGAVLVDGVDVRKQKREPLLDKFGMLFQGGALFDSMRVWENVAFRVLRQKSAEECRALAVDKLLRVGLGEDTADRYPAELSGGMQKRVGLARAIATSPEIIFFDEPTTGLDPIMADVINALIRELVDEMKCTAMTITHDMSSVRKIGDKVAMLYDGVIQWCGPVDALEGCDNPYIDQFVHGREDGPIEALR